MKGKRTFNVGKDFVLKEIYDMNPEDEIQHFFEKLRKQQKPLEEEFEKILHENLWDILTEGKIDEKDKIDR